MSLAFLGSAGGSSGVLKSTMPDAPDIVLILVDSLRADGLGCYGRPLPTSPAIDALARSGVRFAHAFASAPWTQPSVMSLFMSVSPDRHRMVLPNVPHAATNLTTLAERLREAGYQTIGITANPMPHRRYGYARGFEFYDDFTIAMDPGVGDMAQTISRSGAQAATGATVTRLALDWLRRRDPGRPLFLFLFYMDPHWDYIPPPDSLGLFTDDPIPALRNIYSLGKKAVDPTARARIHAAYAGEIRYTDDCIGRLLAAIRESPRAAATAVALCGDHGESFWERGKVAHGNNLYDEELHVPLIIRPPGGAPNGVVVTGQVGLIDLAPTLLDLAGVAPPAEWQGVSLRPCVTNAAPPDRPLILDNRIIGGFVRGVRTTLFKLIARPPFNTPTEVYDLAADPGETNNLAAGAKGIPATALALIPLLCTDEVPPSTPKETNP